MAKKQKDENLIGTLYATFGIGIIIVLLWVTCFMMFANRI